DFSCNAPPVHTCGSWTDEEEPRAGDAPCFHSTSNCGPALALRPTFGCVPQPAIGVPDNPWAGGCNATGRNTNKSRSPIRLGCQLPRIFAFRPIDTERACAY